VESHGGEYVNKSVMMCLCLLGIYILMWAGVQVVVCVCVCVGCVRVTGCHK